MDVVEGLLDRLDSVPDYADLGDRLGDGLLFSDLIAKFRRIGQPRPRVLVVTQYALLVLTDTHLLEVKREILLPRIRALVFSGKSKEVVVQVKTEHDLRIRLAHRREFCAVLSERLKTYFFVPLPVYIVADPSLEGLAASRIEFEKMSEEVRRHVR
jgi:hypothetical protein